jgi:hypothetical protein
MVRTASTTWRDSKMTHFKLLSVAAILRLDRAKGNSMPASESLFCFTSNKIDFHPCPNCRAPMLVRSKSACVDLSERMFECFNCDNVVVDPSNNSDLSL